MYEDAAGSVMTDLEMKPEDQCDGMKQSPIDIPVFSPDTEFSPALTPILFEGFSNIPIGAKWTIKNTGTTSKF